MSCEELIAGQAYCTVCDRDKLPHDGWRGEGHMAIREWQRDGGRQRCLPNERSIARFQHEQIGVYLDGAYCPDVYEFEAGRFGWIIHAERYDRMLATCPSCWDGVIVRFVVGRVECGGRKAA